MFEKILLAVTITFTVSWLSERSLTPVVVSNAASLSPTQQTAQIAQSLHDRDTSTPVHRPLSAN